MNIVSIFLYLMSIGIALQNIYTRSISNPLDILIIEPKLIRMQEHIFFISVFN